MLLMGDTFTPMDVIFDTGSDWLAIEGFECVSCEGNTFNAERSGKIVNDNLSRRIYGSANLLGLEYEDQVCLHYETCLYNFLYFSIVDQNGLKEPIDGLVGLARTKPFFKSDEEREYGFGHLLVEELFLGNHIDSPVFSFYFTSLKEQVQFASYVHFGRPEEAAMMSGMEVKYIQVHEDFFWSANLERIAFGDLASGNVFSFEEDSAIYTIFDTGSSHVILPNIYYLSFTKNLAALSGQKSFEVENGRTFVDCKADYATIFFMLQDKWIELATEDYIDEV
jgi:hypothetical protein